MMTAMRLKSIFEPTHVLNAGGDSTEGEEFSLFQKNDPYSAVWV